MDPWQQLTEANALIQALAMLHWRGQQRLAHIHGGDVSGDPALILISNSGWTGSLQQKSNSEQSAFLLGAHTYSVFDVSLEASYSKKSSQLLHTGDIPVSLLSWFLYSSMPSPPSKKKKKKCVSSLRTEVELLYLCVSDL